MLRFGIHTRPPDSKPPAHAIGEGQEYNPAPHIHPAGSDTRGYLGLGASHDDPENAKLVDLGGRRSHRPDEARGLADELQDC